MCRRMLSYNDSAIIKQIALSFQAPFGGFIKIESGAGAFDQLEARIYLAYRGITAVRKSF